MILLLKITLKPPEHVQPGPCTVQPRRALGACAPLRLAPALIRVCSGLRAPLATASRGDSYCSNNNTLVPSLCSDAEGVPERPCRPPSGWDWMRAARGEEGAERLCFPPTQLKRRSSAFSFCKQTPERAHCTSTGRKG